MWKLFLLIHLEAWKVYPHSSRTSAYTFIMEVNPLSPKGWIRLCDIIKRIVKRMILCQRMDMHVILKRKREKYASVLWRKPLHPQNNPKIYVTAQKRHHQNHRLHLTTADRLRTVSWRVTTATQLVWLNRFTGSQPSHLPQKLCNQKDTHLKICK